MADPLLPTDPLLTTLRKIAVTAAVLASFAGSAYAAHQATETEIKAAYLYNFTKFIEWPAAAASGEPFRLCVLDDDRLKRAIDQTIEGESTNGRELRSLTPRTPAEAATCQVLFIGRSEPERAAKFMAATFNLPVLTVSDSSASSSQGADVEFVLEGNRLRFDVNLTGAERRGLKISSKLLRVARNVREVPK